MIWFLRILERIHGYLGWLSVAALIHPAVLLRRPERRARLATGLATGSILTCALIGAWLYPEYRQRIKPVLFADRPALGWAFERKEQLAIGVVAFALIGCVLHLAVSAFAVPLRLTVARLAHRCFVIAAALALVVATLGVIVATYETF